MRKVFRVAAVAVALSIPVSGLSLGLAGTAGAKKVLPKPSAGSSVVCTKLKYKSKTKVKKGVTTTTTKLTISKCYNSAGVMVPGAIVSTNPAALEGGGALTWTTGSQTVVQPLAPPNGLIVATPGACPAGETEYTANGTVIAGTTQSATPVGDKTSGSVCVLTSGTTTTLTLVAPGFNL